jgi:hypothetical protein
VLTPVRETVDNQVMSGNQTPLVVQYLYVHEPGEAFFYPTARSQSSVASVAQRYLECALTQAASLQLQDVECDLALATNLRDRSTLGRAGEALLARIEALGVRILPTAYRHRPSDDGANYISSRYVLDAIMTATEGQPAERRLWFTDLDCVWADAARTFAASPPAEEVGCIFPPYSPDWIAGISKDGWTRNAIWSLARGMGALEGKTLPPWIGGELLMGTPEPLRALVKACEEIDARLTAEGKVLGAEEEILSLVGALDLVRYHDLSSVARRIHTGARQQAPKLDVETAVQLGLWHLPAEKGLSFRRTASEMLKGPGKRLRRDLRNTPALAHRFNVAGTGLGRRLRDDAWLAGHRIRGKAGALLQRG